MAKELQVYTGGEVAVATPAGATTVARAIGEMGVGLFDLEGLRVPSGGGTTWEVPTLEGTTPEKELRVVITNIATNQRAWYRTDAGDGPAGPPDCSSTDGVHGRGFNTREAPGDDERAHDYKCAACPWSAWESDRNGGRGADCREFAWVVCFPLGSSLPLQLSVPRTSLKALRRYGVKLLGAGLKPEQVVTKLTLTKVGTGATAYATIEFTPDKPLDGEAQTIVDGVVQSCAKLLTSREHLPQQAEPAADGLV